jgi:hypothetical protein
MSTQPGAVESAPKGALARMAGVLFSPGETFSDIVQRPSWLAPVLVLTAFSILFTVMFSQRVGWERFMQQQFAKDPRTAEMPAERRAQALEQASKFAKGFGYGFAVVGYFVITAALAGILLLGYNVGGGAQTNYKTALAITAHSYMPNLLAGLLAMLVMFLKDPDEFDLQNPLASNVAAFLSGEAPRWQQSLGQSLDLVSFWIMFLIAAGFSATNPKRLPMGKSLGVILGLWAFYVLVKVGWAAAFS